jgi:hypothetical protein
MIRRAVAALVLIAGVASLTPGVRAQTPDPSGERQPLGMPLLTTALADLPSGATIFSLLDTSIAELISDRIDAGSMMPGQAARLGAHGSSWTQTMFRVGAVDISDARASGTPLVIPGVLGWQRVDVATGALPRDMNASGPVVTLVPARPTSSWTRSVEFSGAPSFLLSRRKVTVPPAIARLDGWNSASLFASGPIVPNRLGMVAAASLTSSRYFERSDPTELRDRLGSLFTHFLFTPNDRDEIRIVGWAQRTRSPFEHRVAYGQRDAAQRDTSLHLQAEWQRPRDVNSAWTGFLSFSRRGRTTDLQPVAATVTERLADGPVADLIDPIGSDRAWSIGAALTPVTWGRRHTPQAGTTLSGGSASARTPFAVRIGELVDGVPARIWDFSAPGPPSQWHEVTWAAYAGDTFIVNRRVTIDGGLRFEIIKGSGATNPQGVSWHDWFPSLGVRWELTTFKRIAAIARLERYGHRLPIGDFAYGDSSMPTGDVYRWSATGSDPAASQRGDLIARVGPGSGGDPVFIGIDPNLGRPYVNELTFGFESRPDDRSVVRMLAVVRHEGGLIGLVNVGVPNSSYLPITFIDPGVDHGAGQTLIAFNRAPATFGADRYVLTNPAGHHATFASVEVTVRTTINRLFLLAGATAGRSEETSANRGFLASENDQGLIGEVFTNPNAETNARGRPFTERGYTIKTAGTYRFSETVRLGVAARYQDGQHFARLVLVPDLNQGTEALRAFVNGKTRFTYTMTFDARLQKDFTVGRRRLTGLLDVYNLLNTRTEIEEFALTGPLSRTISAVQPPRSVRLGLKLAF